MRLAFLIAFVSNSFLHITPCQLAVAAQRRYSSGGRAVCGRNEIKQLVRLSVQRGFVNNLDCAQGAQNVLQHDPLPDEAAQVYCTRYNENLQQPSGQSPLFLWPRLYQLICRSKYKLSFLPYLQNSLI